MKRIILDNLANKMPANTAFISFIDNESHEHIINLCRGLFGENANVIIAGCTQTLINNNNNILCDPGLIVVNGELFSVPGTTLSALGVSGFLISEQIINDTFKNGNLYPLYLNRVATWSGGYVSSTPANFYALSSFKRWEHTSIDIAHEAIIGVTVSKCNLIKTPNSQTLQYDATCNVTTPNFNSAVKWKIAPSTIATQGRIGDALVRCGGVEKHIHIYSNGVVVYFIIDESAGTTFNFAASINSIISHLLGNIYPGDGLVRITFNITINN
jgi:hypothetical protein